MKKLLDFKKPWEPSQAGVVLAQEIINQYGYSKGPVWFMDLRDENLKQVAEKINSPLCQFFHDKESREKVSYHIWNLCMDWQQYYAVNNVFIQKFSLFAVNIVYNTLANINIVYFKIGSLRKICLYV